MKTLAHEESYRGPKTLKKMAEQPVTICGCGAVGSNLVDNMVRQGFENLTVIDFDRIEEHNRHTQIYTKRDVGQLKTSILKNMMYLARDVKIQDKPVKLDESNVAKLLIKGSIVVDGFDNVESRGLVTRHCRNNGIDCLHVGLAPDFAEVVWNEIYIVPKKPTGPDVCEYPLARNTVMIAAAVATDVLIRFLTSNVKESYEITLGDLRITPRDNYVPQESRKVTY